MENIYFISLMNIINKLINMKWLQYLNQKFSANLLYTLMSFLKFLVGHYFTY